MKILGRLDRTVVDGHESSRNKPYRFQPLPAHLPEVFPNDRHAALPHCYRRILKLFCSDLLAEHTGSGRPCRFYGRTAAELRSALAGASPGPTQADQISRFFTSSALSSMNLRRASTSSPISVVKIASQAAISSSFTESSVRRSGSMVVSQSCCEDISPKPL